MEDSPNSLVEKLGTLDEEERAQLVSWAVSNDAELMLAHQRKMFQVRVASAIVLAPVVVFVVEYLRSVITGHPMDAGLMTLFSGVFGAAIVQFFMRLAEARKAKKEREKRADNALSLGRFVFGSFRSRRGRNKD